MKIHKVLRYAGYYQIAVGAMELLNQQSTSGSVFGTFASLPSIGSMIPSGSMNVAYIDLAVGVGAVIASHHLGGK